MTRQTRFWRNIVLIGLLGLPAIPVDSRQEKPAPFAPAPQGVGSVQASGQVPDIQVVVGPGKSGWQVALVYPKKVDRARVEQDIQSVAAATGAPAVKPEVETRRLDRADSSQVGEAPVMTSATFETAANLVDYPQGRVAVESLVSALQQYNRVAMVFLIPGKFLWTGGTQFEDERLRIDASIGEGALVFVANIRSRPIAKFQFPGPAPKNDSAAPTVKSRKQPALPSMIAWLGAIGVGGLVFFAVRMLLRK